VTVQSDDFYQFAVESDDGSVLEIDDEVVVDNDGIHGSRVVTGHIPLRQGAHKFKLRYFQAQGGATLRVSWVGSGGAFQPLAGSANTRSEEHTSELQSRENLVCRLLLEKKK